LNIKCLLESFVVELEPQPRCDRESPPFEVSPGNLMIAMDERSVSIVYIVHLKSPCALDMMSKLKTYYNITTTPDNTYVYFGNFGDIIMLISTQHIKYVIYLNDIYM